MKNIIQNQVYVIGGGLAGAGDAGRKLLENKDWSGEKNENAARTVQYISSETVPLDLRRDRPEAPFQSQQSMTWRAATQRPQERRKCHDQLLFAAPLIGPWLALAIGVTASGMFGALLWQAPHPRGCVRLADAMPLAGDCNRATVNTLVHNKGE